MRKLLIALIFCLMALLPVQCKKAPPPCNSTSPNRIGAVCNDGTTVYTVDAGTCSNNGGVKSWICD